MRTDLSRLEQARPADLAAPTEPASQLRPADPSRPSRPSRPSSRTKPTRLSSPTSRSAPTRMLSRRARRLWLIAHVVVSMGWLGLDLGLLTLGITGLATGDPATMRAAYLAMGVFADVLLIPISLLSLVTGVVLSLFTPWGLVRYRWVLVKFGLTMIAATATILALRPTIGKAVAHVSALPAGAMRDADLATIGGSLVVAPTVAFTIYLTCTVLSVLKPWGRTRWGARRR